MSTEELEKLLNAGIRAARAGRKGEARRYLEQVLERDDANEQAWLVMASVVDTPRERRICLENALEINPNNEQARKALEALRPSPPSGGVTTPAPRPAAGTAAPTTRASRLHAPPVTAPTRRAGETTQGAQVAWRRQRVDQGLNSTLLFAILLSATLLIIGLVIVIGNQPEVAATTPTPTPPVVAVDLTQTAAAQTPLPRGTLVEFVPDPLAVPPTWTPTITPTPLPSQTPLPTLPPLASYALLFLGEGRGRSEPAIYAIDGTGANERLLFESEGRVADPALSPDGKRLAYVTVVEEREQLAVANADGSNPQIITQMGGTRVRTPAWSPDSARLAFVSDEAGNDEIYVIDANGQNLRRITDHRYADLDPAWSPDGSKLVYASDTTGKQSFQIFVRGVDAKPGSPAEQLTHSQRENYSPAWSPNGASIVFISTRDRAISKVFIMRADGTDERILTIGDGNAANRDPVWSPDSHYIAFSSNRNGGVFQLFIMTPDGRTLEQVTNAPSDSYRPQFRPGF